MTESHANATSTRPGPDAEGRVPCGGCGAPILRGAKKCRVCKAWQGDARASIGGPAPATGAPDDGDEKRRRRPYLIAAVALASTLLGLATQRRTTVGEAPPLTPLVADPASGAAEPPPAEPAADLPPPPEPKRDEAPEFRVKDYLVGDFHPLDVVLHPNGKSVYVSGDDASLREYRLKTGELLHRASMPAQGDRLRLLFDRYVAVLRHEDAARIPVMDTTTWDRDPRLLEVGRGPGEIVELPDGRSVVAATLDGKRVSKFDLPTGRKLANIALSHPTGQLFLVRAEGRPYVAALGALAHAGRPSGAWLDLFDPEEQPFGATRRSISVGRDPSDGALSADGTRLFFPDRVSNTATLVSIAATTEARTVAVGRSPEAGFLMEGDRYGVTLNSASHTASVVDLATMNVVGSLMLDGEPRSGAVSRDERWLFVTLGGQGTPAKGSGVAVITGDPPRVVGSYPTGRGASAVTVSRDGRTVVVANYVDRSITVLER